jgi:hypothetical protein
MKMFDVQDEVSKSMVVEDAESYRLLVTYVAPAFDVLDRKRLQESGVYLPASPKYESTTTTFETKASDSPVKLDDGTGQNRPREVRAGCGGLI